MKDNPVLITVDLNLSLVPGALPDPVRQSLIRHLQAFRIAGLPIVHALGGSRVLHAAQARDAVDARLLPDPDARLYGHFLERGYLQRLGPNEVAMHKPGAGIFYGTGLERYLRAMGTDTMVIAGCRFSAGPRAALLQARERRFAAILLEDAVSGMYALARAEAFRLGAALRDAPSAGFRRTGLQRRWLRRSPLPG